MKCKYCDKHCNCPVSNPPCSFCTDHLACDKCGEVFCQDLEDEDDLALCPECLENKRWLDKMKSINLSSKATPTRRKR